MRIELEKVILRCHGEMIPVLETGLLSKIAPAATSIGSNSCKGLANRQWLKQSKRKSYSMSLYVRYLNWRSGPQLANVFDNCCKSSSCVVETDDSNVQCAFHNRRQREILQDTKKILTSTYLCRNSLPLCLAMLVQACYAWSLMLQDEHVASCLATEPQLSCLSVRWRGLSANCQASFGRVQDAMATGASLKMFEVANMYFYEIQDIWWSHKSYLSSQSLFLLESKWEVKPNW